MSNLIEQIKADRAAGTPGPWIWNKEQCAHFNDWCITGVIIASEYDGTPEGDEIDRANARRIARVPEMEQSLIDQAAEIERLRTAIKRQAGAAKTLRQITLDEVAHLTEKDRSEYASAKMVESERRANEILTNENERLRAALTCKPAEQDAAKVLLDTSLADLSIEMMRHHKKTKGTGSGGYMPSMRYALRTIAGDRT